MRRFFFCNFVAVGLRAWTTFPSIASEVTAFLKRSNNSCKSDKSDSKQPVRVSSCVRLSPFPCWSFRGLRLRGSSLACRFAPVGSREILHFDDLQMFQALNSTTSSSLSKLFVSRNTFPYLFHLSISSNSKMEEQRTPSVVQTNLDSHSGCQSGPRFKSSMNTKVGKSSSLSPSRTSRTPQSVENQRMQISTKRAIGASQEKRRGSESEEVPYHICIPTDKRLAKLKKSLLESNREKRKERERPVGQYLRPGMVLLQKCLGLMDQVEIVNKCYELGIGSAGFYRPGYRDGAKLHLQMMCLGKDWNPESRLYDKSRSFDGAVTPEIPEEFSKLVDRALNKSHEFLREHGKKVEEIPNMSPDICIVNFYSNSGKLGLHQDRDESEESLNKGLPVVSFSIGDSAEFLYSDERDVDKAEKVMLESGDVLIFGGPARHIFHGVSSIKPKTGPEILIDETTKLRPGRLNLTFRQY